LGSFDIADDQGNLYNIIIEEKADTDLNQIINEKNKNKQAFTDEEKAQIFENLLTNLYMLHMNGIAHNDIKPSNILYYDKFKKYIIRDYGECEKFDGPCDFNKFQSNILRGTASYMSPQLKENYIGYLTKEKKIHDTTHNPFKSDIYSLGVVFLQVHLTGSSPQKKFLCFNDKDKDENILKYLMKQQQNSIDEIIENQIEDFFGKYEKYMEISDEGGLIKYQKKKKLFQYMLSENEKDRMHVLELSLLYDLPLFLWPFSTPPDIFNFDSQISRGRIKRNYITGFFYKGTLQQERRHGKGTLKTSKQVYYKGQWKDNFPQGKGVIQFNEHYRYEGDVYFGKLNGKGNIYFQNDCQDYFGNEWVRNKMKKLLFTKENFEFKLNCYYVLNPFEGYFENIYDGPSEILISPENFIFIYPHLVSKMVQKFELNVKK